MVSIQEGDSKHSTCGISIKFDKKEKKREIQQDNQGTIYYLIKTMLLFPHQIFSLHLQGIRRIIKCQPQFK